MTTTSSPLINKPTQLTLHAILGCAVGTASNSDCASGAIAGVIGEQIAETAYNNGVNRNTAIQLASLTSAISSITYSSLTNQSDEQIAKNTWEGSRIGGNAGKENAYFAKRPLESDYKKTSKLLSKLELEILDKNNMEVAHEQLFFEDKEGGNIGYFSDNSVRSDREDLLKSYVKSKDGFDDILMRKAVNNLQNITHPYDLIGFETCIGKYNCQDWASDVRREYYRLKIEDDIQFWNKLIYKK